MNKEDKCDEYIHASVFECKCELYRHIITASQHHISSIYYFLFRKQIKKDKDSTFYFINANSDWTTVHWITKVMLIKIVL